MKDVRLIFRGSELPNWRPMTVFFENPVKRLLWAVRGGSAQASIRPFARSQTFRSKELLRVLEEVCVHEGLWGGAVVGLLVLQPPVSVFGVGSPFQSHGDSERHDGNGLISCNRFHWRSFLPFCLS